MASRKSSGLSSVGPTVTITSGASQSRGDWLAVSATDFTYFKISYRYLSEQLLIQMLRECYKTG
jgi:hypothetical protein